MQPKIGCFIIPFLLILPVSPIEWSVNISMPFSIDYGIVMKKVYDGYIALVSSFNLLENKSYGRIIKIDRGGNIEWENKFLTDGNGNMGICTQNNSYIILFSCNGKACLTKLNKNGKIEWNKSYEFLFSIKASRYIINVNGNLIFSLHNLDIDEESIIVKTDGNGNILWKKYFNYSTGIVGLEDGYVVIEQPITFCRNYSLLFKYDFNDILLWKKRIDGIGYSIYPAINGFILYHNHTCIKFDKRGNKEWEKEFEKGIEISSCSIAKNGYLLAGTKTFPKIEGILIKLDENGNEIWRKTYFTRCNIGIFILRNVGFLYAEEVNDSIIGMLYIDAEPNAIFVYFPPFFILLTWLSFIETDVVVVKIHV